MFGSLRGKLAGSCCLVLGLSLSANLSAASPTAAQALALKPMQADVDYETPAAADIDKCTLKIQSGKDGAGWVVLDGAGQLLRRFVDSNSDNKVDMWCYYKNGIEVYRDLDANFNGKADQYRWMGTEGIRWGLDEDEDGVIDRWKVISAEEAAAEVVAALRARDAARFKRLLLSSTELEGLGLGAVQTQELAKKAAEAAKGFAALATSQTVVAADTQWLHFGASRPGLIPIGTDGSTKDVIVYDNVSSVVQTGGKPVQLNLGTMIRVGDAWRLIDLPQELAESRTVTNGYFFQQGPARATAMAAGSEGSGEKEQQLVRKLDDLEKKLQAATTAEQQAAVNGQRADVLEQLIEAATTQEGRDAWTRQLIDSVSAAAQAGAYPAGIERLRKLADRLAKTPQMGKHAAHAEFTAIAAEYAQNVQKADADGFSKVQEKWLADLAKFVEANAQSDDAAEAMLHLAVAEELGGKSEQAVLWYRKIVEQFPKTDAAKKAAGARRRLDSVGQALELQGTTLEGKALALSTYRGRTVLIHYWASWCEPCKQDMETLKRLQAKYAKQGLMLIGVNIDSERAAAVAYYNANPLPWPQLYEAGGLDSRLAVELGILTLPTMVLVDKEGKVLNRNIHAAELDEELAKRMK